MIEPLRISFVVECSPEHAFDTWTRRATAWWPPAHTASHERGAEIVFEPRPGGRIYERTPRGDEIEWGAIVEWDRPRRLRYLWHIATDPKNATDVDIVFRALPDETTRVEIEHGGWRSARSAPRGAKPTTRAGTACSPSTWRRQRSGAEAQASRQGSAGPSLCPSSSSTSPGRAWRPRLALLNTRSPSSHTSNLPLVPV